MEWYRWFPELYAEATIDLTLEQDAIYRRLIDWYMLKRMPLPCSGIGMARICQISLDKWQEHEKLITRFFVLKGGKYHHKRCDLELDRQDLTSKKLGDAAKKAHEARRKNIEESNASMPCHSQADALPPIEENRIEENRKKDSLEPELVPTAARVTGQETFLSEPPGFAIFWALYPPGKRGARSEAVNAYFTILKNKTATEEEIHEGLKRYLASDEPKQGIFTRADNWLKRERWKNDFTNRPKAGPANGLTAYERGLMGGVNRSKS